MSEVHVRATLPAAPGKADRLKEVIVSTVKAVLEKEPDTFMFQFFEEVKEDGTSVFYAEETYKNQAAVDAHLKTLWFQAVAKAFEEENLLASPLEIKHVTPFAGFKSR